MKKIVLASMIALAAAGCQPGNKPAPTTAGKNPSAMDLGPTPSLPMYAAPTPTPIAQPIYEAPVTATPIAASPAPSYSATPSTPAAGGSYKVRKGDTLFGIARKTYGDGKQWTRIQKANPGLTASTLKVGQTISLP